MADLVSDFLAREQNALADLENNDLNEDSHHGFYYYLFS